MVARLADIKNSIKVGRLSGRSEHGRRPAFHGANFSRHRIVGRILQTGIKVAGRFQVKQRTHFVAGVIFKCCTLIDRQLAGFAFARFPALVNGLGFNLCHTTFLSFCFRLSIQNLANSLLQSIAFVCIIFGNQILQGLQRKIGGSQFVGTALELLPDQGFMCNILFVF